MVQRNDELEPAPPVRDNRGRARIESLQGMRHPLILAFAAELAVAVTWILVILTLPRHIAAPVSIALGVMAAWAIPYFYLGREHSLRDDGNRGSLRDIATYDALSGDRDVPVHPVWWKESGDATERPVWMRKHPLLRARLVRTTVLCAVALSVAGLVFRGTVPDTVWPLCWMSSFLALWWARSTRRESFHAFVGQLISRENLSPQLGDRVRLEAETVALGAHADNLRRVVAELEQAIRAARAEGVPPGIAGSLMEIRDRASDIQLKLAESVKDADQRATADKLASRRFDWQLAVGSVFAGAALGVLTDRLFG
jgi:hypothetical protein